MTMTEKYDTQYINSLPIPELKTLLEEIAVILVKYHGVPVENMSFLKESESFSDLTFLTLTLSITHKYVSCLKSIDYAYIYHS
jgi:hypothetical protein